MRVTKTTTVAVNRAREEAQRLNLLGSLRITFDGAIPSDREKKYKVRCVGFAVNENEEDCLLFNGPYGMSGRFCVRCIPASKIITVEYWAKEEGE